MEFQAPTDDEHLYNAQTFKRIAGEYGKSTPQLREMVRESTTLFIHYVIDYALQKRQGPDGEGQYKLTPSDILRALEELGFDSIANKIK